ALDGYLIAVSFYNILGFYVLALATALWWLGFLARRSAPVVTSLILALGLFAVWRVAGAAAPDAMDSLLEWPRLMLVANYSYFRLMAFTLCGVAIGCALARRPTGARADAAMIAAGGLGVFAAVMIALQTYGPTALSVRLGPFFTSHLGAAFYIALALLLLGGTIRMIGAWNRLPGLVGIALRLLIVIGGLALPIYAFHSVVIPVKDILLILDAPGALALAAPMAVFLGSMIYAGQRLYRTYFR
ncbi:MAG: hypothetical protein AAFU55_13840, partial [Pseudomonadota bacterium]